MPIPKTREAWVENGFGGERKVEKSKSSWTCQMMKRCLKNDRIYECGAQGRVWD